MKGKEELLEKLGSEVNELDLSKDEDLSIALMNLISLEEHLYFSAMKTKKTGFIEKMYKIRGIRTELMKEIVDKGEGEEWCISKHLLAASMRVIETANKIYEEESGKAENLYNLAFDLYSMFWGINLGLEDEEDLETETLERGMEEESSGWLENTKEIVKKVIDCCVEK
ncbi:hypothetical protein AKJ51_02225 [candidate division MSBL1 archaeon SCGC-AAA382A20]|uniref:Uncharacterized protein n=1 Tax=candidate division MSBL1 archaeon SCGC-AAA382A20 TaxID=1698280 RepID=A0A133VKP9_9EURY|nr:hypothetical protein AKJ51_02225 [candidate division MSBL1 archaeon SCGC-AAA382A20]